MEESRMKLIIRTLDHFYPSPPVPLNNCNDFTFLVAVVLSAQTTDGKVNEVTKILFKHASTPEEMMKLTPSFVQNIIQPVGLAPKKSEYVVGLSKLLVQNFNGQVPNNYKDLESLPGVGHKTASVIMSQLYGVPSFAVDTHVHRLALRWNISKDSKNVNKVQQDLCNYFPQDSWNKLHLQMIYFGREYCPAKDHQTSECPICSWINNKTKIPNFDEIIKKLENYSPKKKYKALVYYEDRTSELIKDPELCYHSPYSPSRSNQKSIITIKTEIDIKNDLVNEFNDDTLVVLSKNNNNKRKIDNTNNTNDNTNNTTDNNNYKILKKETNTTTIKQEKKEIKKETLVNIRVTRKKKNL